MGGLPLGYIVHNLTSAGAYEFVFDAFKKMLPNHAFFNKGPNTGR
jgi:hypothetical protein